jgi:hypothetical protein
MGYGELVTNQFVAKLCPKKKGFLTHFKTSSNIHYSMSSADGQLGIYFRGQ